MPFCEECARYWTPTAMSAAGTCPSCGRILETKPAESISGSSKSPKVDLRSLAASGRDEDVSAPWHFKLLVTGLVLYLGWRVIDLFL